jgi:alkylation response protein AidB-like acyl-CoA dehydrogenase
MEFDPNRPLWTPYGEPDFVSKVARFVEMRIKPVAQEIDSKDYYPVEVMKVLASDGLSSITLPRRFGGSEKNFTQAVALFEEVAVGSAAVAVSLITTFQAQTIVNLFGSDTLKERYLPMFCRGMIAAYALTEASHGSDIRKLDTKAHREGNRWVITGEKSFITSGSAAEFFVILAETDTGVSAFAVPRDTPNLSHYVGDNSATFGLRNGPHVNLRLDGVEIPEDHLIGVEGKGVRQAVTTLNFSRTLAAAISIGIARAAFEAALAYAQKRVAFDRTISEFQGIQWYFADMLTEIDAARLLVYRAALALDNHEDIDRYGSAAKLMASEVATKVASQAVQICGAYGVQESSPFGRFFRDAKAYEIAGGSKEVLKNTISKFLGKRIPRASAA